MSKENPVPNTGAKAVDENLAGTRDEFNDEVTKVLLEDVQADKNPGDDERDAQPALAEDEQTPANPDNS